MKNLYYKSAVIDWDGDSASNALYTNVGLKHGRKLSGMEFYIC